jgi:Type ISP C-terminal specificity domain
MLLDYLDRVFTTEQRGDDREESYYPHLLDLLLRCAAHRGRNDVHVTMIPRKTKSCLLDFQVWRGHRIAGYVEAKRPAANLDLAAESEQLRRYRDTFPNLLLTNFRELRLYRGRDLAAREEIGRLGHEPERLFDLLDLFLDFETPPSASAASLARQLAWRTRVLAARIGDLLERDEEGTSDLAGFYQAFSEYLLAGLTSAEFADLYAQTLAYGLLTARWRAPAGFDRRAAAEHIPRANGILRDAFQLISLGAPAPEIGWIVDDLIDLLAAAPVRKILERRTGDPVLHFYETFLAFYDRGLRKRRGVYYTPRPVVSFMVRSVHRLLETRLGRRGGLANPTVTLLDPAAGTLTFPAEAIRCAVDAARSEVGEGSVPALLRDHLLRDFHAFELMMAPYAVGHLKVGLLLEELGHPLGEDERFKLYLTNTLDTGDLEQSSLPGFSSLSRESREAGRIKGEQPILVILGNPPWSGHSANRGKGTDRLVREPYAAADGRRDEGYHRVDGRPLGERNSKWLQDDYVKFLRFAQRKIDQGGEGIVALVTNHGWLDNPTFRGMRRSLLATFDEIHLLDLHGNSKKRERSPDGTPDDNVFDNVAQGVAIALLVKRPGLPKRVLRADLWGSRGAKLRWLEGHDVETVPWREVIPEAPACLFSPRDACLEEEYARGISLPEIFPEHSAGIVTGRDELVMALDLAELRRRIGFFRGMAMPDDVVRDGYGLRDTGSWSLAEARRRARADGRWEERLTEILVRPFDRRYVFYADYLIERPRKRVMGHLLSVTGNLGLIVPRQHKEEPGALVTDRIAGHKAVSAYDVNTVFPLWLRSGGLLGEGDRVPNVAPDLLARLTRDYGEEPSPREILGFTYAVLYSETYRRRYADFLRRDFPRVPFPSDREAFLTLAAQGARLVDLHLLRSDRLERPAVRFEGRGSGRLGTGRAAREYRPAERRVVVNGEGQAFTGIAPEVWAYRIGGHQVLDRWLAVREGRVLALEEIEHFRRVATALRITIEVQERIDEGFTAVAAVSPAGRSRDPAARRAWDSGPPAPS